MKGIKVALIIMLGVAVTFGLAGTASAFHAGGVAHCDGCHTMHNSQGGAINAQGGSVGTGLTGFLTKGADPSSTCLGCHANIYKAQSTDGSAYTPGGDFFWLSKSYSGSHYSSSGPSHGHNTIASNYSIVQDNVLSSGPSNGTVVYQASWLGCNSCHDPHGKIANNTNPAPISESGSYGAAVPTDNSVLGNYRLLGGLGYDGGEQATSISFAGAAPKARAYAGSKGQWPAETETNHVDYGFGMSEWCANCHSGFTADGAITHRHPASNDAHLNGQAVNYNSYVTTGNMGGQAATAYTRLVPFERGVTDTTTLNTATTQGPDANSNVMCLTCHRAHASAFSDIGKWDFQEELLADSPQLVSAEATHVYYGETITTKFGQYQRSLCNKCHVQD